MTYTQLRDALIEIARFGDEGAPHALCRPGRWRHLRVAGVVVQAGERWTITDRGWQVLQEPAMPKRRPRGRPSHHTHHQPGMRKAS